MAKTIEVEATVRTGTGKGASRRQRAAGQMPAVIYGRGEKPVSITLNSDKFFLGINNRVFATVYVLKVAGDTIHTVPRDIQLDPVTDRPIHVDFLRVGDGTRIDVDVPVEFINHEKSPGLKRGAVLNTVRRTVELWAPWNQIPSEIVIDLDGAQINDTIHISHVKLPKGVTPVIGDRDFTIATITAPTALKKELAAEAAADVSVAAPAKGKKK
jgi:large subunit ribosomal protein L25